MKRTLTALMAVLMIAALMVGFTGCGSKDDDDAAARIAALEQENAALRAQLEALAKEADVAIPLTALQSWDLSADAWSDGNGATVTFTAAPISYADGQKVALSVRMGELEAESTNCVWDGSVYTGSVELSAADGYSYYCVLTATDGTQTELLLNGPDSITNEMLVYLGSNLTAYANLVLEDWSSDAKALTIAAGYARAQLARLTAADNVTISDSALVLKRNGEEVERQSVTLPEGEGDGSYELALSNVRFAMPEMEDDYNLELTLEVKLSDGNVITVSGGSWFYNEGELLLVVG